MYHLYKSPVQQNQADSGFSYSFMKPICCQLCRRAPRRQTTGKTTPRLCQKNMTPVALRGRGTTSTYNCFPATSLYFKSKVLASVGRGSTETTRLQHGSSMFGDTHARGGGGGDLATSMATWLSSSLRNENGKLKIFVVRTTLLAKSHRC